ncbi:hypothetical protein CPB86DRAFT_787594 [Serendipita vermifera]|nr:hypothetical protein CPB86DRAFT_787594 [Serendipita vermifera]
MKAVVAEHIKNSEYWGQSTFNYDDLTEPVSKIHFVAHTNEGDLGDGDIPPTNHWTVCLELSSRSFVHFETLPGEDSNEPGMILVESQSIGPTDMKLSCIVSASLPENTSVQDILGLLIEKGRDQYKLTDEGEGCRFWCKTFAEDLADAEYIPQETYAELSKPLMLYWKQAGGTQPRAINAGTFF